MTPKQHLFQLLTCLAFPLGLFAQWDFQNPLPTVHDLYDICYINEQESFAVGASGTILGRNTAVDPDWILLPCPVQEDLNKIVVETDGMAYIAGNNGTVLRSADYGESWTILNSGIYTNLNDIAFIPPGRIWAIGAEGMVIHSGDSGETWAVQELEFDYGLNSIFMHNAEEGWICGNNFSLYHTTDAPARTGISLHMTEQVEMTDGNITSILKFILQTA
ncbi:MAG: YCF48-related protein [Bacteroidota bacterium]|nr:YCF48-related protein [Bacteroidota bacterium]